MLDGRHAGRYGAGGRIERCVRKRQCKPESEPVEHGRIGGEGRGRAKKFE